MKRFQDYRLPRMQRLLEKVRSGALLSEQDIEFLKRVQNDSKANFELVKRNPSYQTLVNKALGLYTEIVERGLENEKNSG